MAMPEKDKKCLEKFFRCLILEDGMGYTLLGKKPVSLGAYQYLSTGINLENLYAVLLPENRKLQKGWRIWSKYRHHFENPNFSIWVEQSPWIENSKIILLVNRKSFNRIVQKHASDFREIIEVSNLTGILDEKTMRPLFKLGLKGHEGLIGTLLGYGRNNAWLFYQRDQGKDVHLSSAWENNLENYTIMSMIKNYLFSKRRNDLSIQLNYPSFVANLDSEETESLKNEYEETRQRILDHYRGKDFLETTLSLLKYGG
ncbi:MAG: hypothetical protein H7A38_02460 [Chlamydiales bacterium]|nr:hypothetical protein [Chlamydiales bacterium]